MRVLRCYSIVLIGNLYVNLARTEKYVGLFDEFAHLDAIDAVGAQRAAAAQQQAAMAKQNFTVDPLVQEFIKWCRDNGIPPEVISYRHYQETVKHKLWWLGFTPIVKYHRDPIDTGWLLEHRVHTYTDDSQEVDKTAILVNGEVKHYSGRGVEDVAVVPLYLMRDFIRSGGRTVQQVF
jgi:hypothetical protein